MTRDEVRRQIGLILAQTDGAIETMYRQWAVQDGATAYEVTKAALVSAIDANRAALKLLNRMMDEGVGPDA